MANDNAYWAEKFLEAWQIMTTNGDRAADGTNIASWNTQALSIKRPYFHQKSPIALQETHGSHNALTNLANCTEHGYIAFHSGAPDNDSASGIGFLALSDMKIMRSPAPSPTSSSAQISP